MVFTIYGSKSSVFYSTTKEEKKISFLKPNKKYLFPPSLTYSLTLTHALTLMNKFNTQTFRQYGSLIIFGAMIFSAAAQIQNGGAKHEWDSMNSDDRYYLPFFKTKKNQ